MCSWTMVFLRGRQLVLFFAFEEVIYFAQISLTVGVDGQRNWGGGENNGTFILAIFQTTEAVAFHQIKAGIILRQDRVSGCGINLDITDTNK